MNRSHRCTHLRVSIAPAIVVTATLTATIEVHPLCGGARAAHAKPGDRPAGEATCLSLALVRATLLTVWHHGFGDLNSLVSLRVSNPRYDSLQGFPFESLGVAVLLILFVMVATTISMVFAYVLLGGAYAKLRRVHLVLDNLDSHARKCFEDVSVHRAADKLLRRVQFHYTSKHAS